MNVRGFNSVEKYTEANGRRRFRDAVLLCPELSIYRRVVSRVRWSEELLRMKGDVPKFGTHC